MKKSFLTNNSVILLFLIFASFGKTIFAQTSPAHFAEGVVETAADEYNPTFAPDGKIVYFARRADRKGHESIMFSELKNGKWNAPQIAAFSGKFYDKEPFVAPDGRRIFFASTRPNGRDAKDNFEIWFVEKTKNGWSEAKNLGANVNTSGYDNYPSVARDGTLYFASKRDGSREIDLYRARMVNGEYQTAENLGNVINTDSTEADPFIAPDQSYIIFSSERDGGAGEGDLYVSFNQNGAWTVPQSLGKTINTPEYEFTPYVSPNGKTFYFSRGWGEIFQIDFSALNFSTLKQTAMLNSAVSAAFPADSSASKSFDSTSRKVVEEIKKMDSLWQIESYGGRDLKDFDRIVADDFLMTGSNSKLQTKAEKRANIAADYTEPATRAAPDYIFKIDESSHQVRVFKSAAISSGYIIEKYIYQGNKIDARVYFTCTYLKRKNRWQAVAAHYTRVKQQ